MSFILNIETATKNCSVSIANDGKLIALREVSDQGYSHAEKLHVFIEDVLIAAGITYNDLAAIAVSRGPGSYTGLRIGVSAAKGFCYALDIPLLSIDTLKILAAQLKVDDGIIIPMLDARRMEVYSAIFSPELQRIRDVEAEIITEESFSMIEETVYFIGDSSEKCRAVLTKPNFIFSDDIIYPSAREMCALSFELFQKSEFEDTAYFEPYYLKDFLITSKK